MVDAPTTYNDGQDNPLRKMSQKNETVALILALVLTGGLVGGGAWWLMGRSPQPTAADNPTSPPGTVTANPSPTFTNNFTIPTAIPNGTQLWIDGSTSMAQFNLAIADSFKSQFPGAVITLQARGTTEGINALIAGQIDLAASSRKLTPQETSQGLESVPVAPDQLALVVSINNPFRGGLTTAQAQGIFTGQITNWSEVGGPNQPIRPFNRPPVSGTHTTFKEMVLQGQDPSGPNLVQMERDETTGMLQQLGNDGIGYATAQQVANQQTVRIVPIDNLNPLDAEYPYQRTLYYVYKNPPSPAVEAFLGFLNSPAAKTAIQGAK